jgi:hypothetical protein
MQDRVVLREGIKKFRIFPTVEKVGVPTCDLVPDLTHYMTGSCTVGEVGTKSHPLGYNA